MPSHGSPAISSRLRSASVTPRPSCRPVTTDGGTIRAKRPIALVAPSTSRIAPRHRPAAAISPADRPLAISTAETAFIGCTGIGSR
jgi:hypothetical protein